MENTIILDSELNQQDCLPYPTQIDCISVNLVHDSCFTTETFCEEIIITCFNGTFSIGQLIPCSINPNIPICCVEVKREHKENNLAVIDLLIKVPILFTNPNKPCQEFTGTLVNLHSATLCCPPGSTIDCSEITLINCLAPIICAGECGFKVLFKGEFCFVIKCFGKEQLLIPSYGICKTPICKNKISC